MNRNFIFVIVLLATLCMANAVPHQLQTRNHNRPTITFNTCPFNDTPTISVTLVPNPIEAKELVKFSVFGILNHNVTAGTTELVIEFADADGKKLLTDAYYQDFTRSFKAGDQVTISAPEVHAPDKLPDVFTIGIAIGDPSVGDPFTPLTIYGCNYAVSGSTSSSSFSFTGIAA